MVNSRPILPLGFIALVLIGVTGLIVLIGDSLVVAQGRDVPGVPDPLGRLDAAGVPGPLITGAPSASIFDEIQDSAERAAFRQMWDSPAGKQQLDLATSYVDRYPRSILLREAYELAARAAVAAGDYAAALGWSRRSLRLIPENPFLLALVANVAMQQGDLGLAETSALDALSYVSNAATPAPIRPDHWAGVRNDLRAGLTVVLARVAASRQRYTDAEDLLTAALRLKPGSIEAVYVLAVVRIALKDDSGAASALARVVRSGDLLSAPAAGLLRSVYERSGQTQPFEKYVASLNWVPPEEVPRASAARFMGRYAGSAACRACHVRQYDSWASTGMSKMFRAYRAGDIAGDFSGQTVAGNARATADGTRHFIEIRESEANNWRRYPVDYIIGSKWQQAYATRLPDARLLVFPIQYSRLQARWLNYWGIVDGPGSARADISRFHEIPEGAVYQNTCASCHTSQLMFERGPDAGSAVFREGGVGCEMCHGPSYEHAAAMNSPGANSPGSGTELPVRFRGLPARQSTAICAQCHAQSAVHEAQAGGEVNYSADGPQFYRTYAAHLPSDFSRSAFYRDGRYRATTFISEAFARSQCFRTGGATCVSCHDPHAPDAQDNQTSLKYRENPDAMCLQCHTAYRDRPERHTRHAPATEASRCVSCHMPRIMDALLFKARSHEIDDIPDAAMTERFGADDSPNACLRCHADRDAAWLARVRP